MLELTKRDQQVLEAVILDYIQSGEPVGSRTISKRYGMQVSPATIRNVMSDLEELGFLYQPHTSAGRIPTQKGLRLYLDFIMKSRAVERQQRALIREALKDAHGDVRDLLHRTSSVLSKLCRQAGVVLWTKLQTTRFRHIEFVRLRPHQVMVILVSRSGLAHHTVLDLAEDIKQDELDKYSRYLVDLLKDVPLGEVKSKLLDEMKKEKVLFDQLYSRALDITQRVFHTPMAEKEVYIEGRTNLFDSPEFADVDTMRRLLQTFEDKSRIVTLLDLTLNMSSSVRVILGPESELQEMHEISLVSSPYRRGGTEIGVLGVIGPLRMDYSRIIPIVEFTAGLLSQILGKPEED